MGEGFDLSTLMSMFGGANAGANFGSGIDQPQLTGMFGGTPQAPGANFMNGAMPSTPTMANFNAGTLPQGQQPLSFGMAGYGQGGTMPNLSGLGALGGMKQPQQAPAMAPQMAGGGGGGNIRGMFSALMHKPTLQQVHPTLGLLGNVMGQ